MSETATKNYVNPALGTQKKAAFQVICPKLRHSHLYKFHEDVKEIIAWVARKSGENKTVYETAILLPENAFKGGYYERSEDVELFSKLVSMTLPREPWFCVAFGILERRDGWIPNTAYLTTRGYEGRKAKLELTNFEKFAFAEYAIMKDVRHTEEITRGLARSYVDDAKTQKKEGNAFLQVPTPTGRRVQYGLCQDVFHCDPEADIVLSSSAGLEIKPGEADHFNLLLAHDGKDEGKLIVEGRNSGLITVKEENGFWVATLLDEPPCKNQPISQQ